MAKLTYKEDHATKFNDGIVNDNHDNALMKLNIIKIGHINMVNHG